VSALPFRPHMALLMALPAALSTLGSVRQIRQSGVGPIWSKLSKGARLVADPGALLRITDVLTSPEMQPIMRTQPLLMFKYVTDYLATCFTQSERAAILLHHYSFLRTRVERHFVRKIVEGRLDLWHKTVRDHTYRIQLTFPHATHSEGDLGLVFRADCVDIYGMGFSIGPGSVVGLCAPHVLYVGRLQGKGGGLALIREATKACSDISPAQLLLAAAEGIALALRAEHVVGIGAGSQISRVRGIAHTYDEFWSALGGQKIPRDMYLLAIPLPEKPMRSIKHKSRPRVVRRRAFKRAVSDVVSAAFVETALRNGIRPSKRSD